MTSGPGYFLSRVMKPVSPTAGESGYFSSPVDTLDPHLFNGETFKPEVRKWIVDTLYAFWGQRYHRPKEWSTVWIAGSGISYQWAAARGNGDLDILIGVDYDAFYQANPSYAALDEANVASIFNEQFHRDLWPRTANQDINGQTYEVTFYVNPNSTDIRNINPYAAYNLSDDSWTVRPPSGDAFNHPASYYANAEGEANTARTIAATYNGLAGKLKALQPGSPQWHNLMNQANVVVSQASTLYDSIHLGRKQAFAPSGKGYGDYYNFRWQYHKQQGTAQALHAISQAHKEARDQYNAQIYGGPIEGADVALRRAAMWNR